MQVYVTRYDGDYHLLVYTPILKDGRGSYAYEVLDYDGMSENSSGQSVEFSINGDEPIDAHALAAFVEELNAIIAKSELIISTVNGEYKGMGTPSSEVYEELNWLYENGMTYEPGDTLQQRIEKYSAAIGK